MTRIESTPHTINRRTLLRGAAAAGLTLGLNLREPTLASQSESNPSTEDRREMIDVTTKHLFDLYSGLMTEENGYVGSINNDVYKRECFLRIAWMADKLNPQNENLGNQIAAVLLHQSEFSTEFEREYQNGTVARGMMRFTPNMLARISEHLGETITLDDVRQMSPLHQLKLVEANLQLCKEQYNTDFDNIFDVYMAAVSPTHIGRNPDETLLDLEGNDVYSELDLDGDQSISIREATKPVIDKAIRFGEKERYILETKETVDILEFVKTADDVKEAYDFATGGDTYDVPGLAEILRERLATKGYSQNQLEAFEERRKNSLVPSGPHGRLGSQCLGWVGTVTALWTGTSNPEKTLNTFWTAGEINDVYASGEPLPIGDFTFKAVAYGENSRIRKGDIAVCGTGEGNDHIGIVYNTLPNTPSNMILIESNRDLDCGISNNAEISKEGYTFYRLIQE